MEHVRSKQSENNIAQPKDLKRTEIDTNTAFYKYFLESQKNAEVYIGNDIAMVVYEDGSIAIQPANNFRCFSAVFLDPDLMSKETGRTLKEIRKPSNGEGINEGLTATLRNLYNALDAWHEEESGKVLYDENSKAHDFYKVKDLKGLEIRRTQQLSFGFVL